MFFPLQASKNASYDHRPDDLVNEQREVISALVLAGSRPLKALRSAVKQDPSNLYMGAALLVCENAGRQSSIPQAKPGDRAEHETAEIAFPMAHGSSFLIVPPEFPRRPSYAMLPSKLPTVVGTGNMTIW